MISRDDIDMEYNPTLNALKDATGVTLLFIGIQYVLQFITGSDPWGLTGYVLFFVGYAVVKPASVTVDTTAIPGIGEESDG